MIGDIWLFISPWKKELAVEFPPQYLSLDNGGDITQQTKRLNRNKRIRNLLLMEKSTFEDIMKAWSPEAREQALMMRKRKQQAAEKKPKPSETVSVSREYDKSEFGEKIGKTTMTKIIDDMGRGAENCVISSQKGELSFEFSGDKFKMQLSIHSDGKVSVGELMSFDKDMSPDLVREKLRGIVEVAKGVGGDRLYIGAGLEDGAYTWARMGFDATKEGWPEYKEDILRKEADVISLELSDADRGRLEAIQSVREVANFRLEDGQKWGKEAMKDTVYDASLFLKDGNPGFEIFKRYMGGGFKRKK